MKNTRSVINITNSFLNYIVKKKGKRLRERRNKTDQTSKDLGVICNETLNTRLLRTGLVLRRTVGPLSVAGTVPIVETVTVTSRHPTQGVQVSITIG